MVKWGTAEWISKHTLAPISSKRHMNTKTRKEISIGDCYIVARQDLKDKKKQFVGDSKQKAMKPGFWFPGSEPTGSHWVGFRIVADPPAEPHFRDALDGNRVLLLENNELIWKPLEPSLVGSYECVGPKVQKNPHGFAQHCFVRHGSIELSDPRVTQFRPAVQDIDADSLREYFLTSEGLKFEGLVIHCVSEKGNVQFFKLHRGHLGLGDFKGASFL